MDQRVIYTNKSGGVSIVIPTPEYMADHTIDDLIAAVVPAGVSHEIVSMTDIPPDRTFRNAWEKVGRNVQHNIPKCKVIAHEKRRIARAAEFAPYDEIIMKQIPGKSAAAAEAARQVIRDKYAAMQIAIDAATTADQIKTVISDILE